MHLRGDGFTSGQATIRNPVAAGDFEVQLDNTAPGTNALAGLYTANTTLLRGNAIDIGVVDFGASATIDADGRIGDLRLAPGGTYAFRDRGTSSLAVDDFTAVGSCQETITLSGPTTGYTLSSTNNQTATYLSISDVAASGATWTANASLDGGGAGGWTFAGALAARTLYWVGGTGNWFDEAHWSLTSGGAGGQCIPTLLDDVILDGNSFSAAGQVLELDLNPLAPVASDPDPVCGSFDARGLDDDIQLDGRELEVYGSVFLSRRITDWDVRLLELWGRGTHVLRSAGTEYRDLHQEGAGTYRLVDVIEAPNGDLEVNNGRFRFNGNNVRVSDFAADEPGAGTTIVDFGADTLFVTNNSISFRVIDENVDLRSSGGTVVMEDGGTVWINTTPDGLHLLSSNPNARMNMSTWARTAARPAPRFGTLGYAGDGRISGEVYADTVLLAKGKAYDLNTLTAPLRIGSLLRAVGTACFPISIAPNNVGSRSQAIFEPGARAEMDYVRLDNFDAAGPGTYLAGRNSTNVNNSSNGWTYDTDGNVRSLDRFFLGPDLNLCGGIPRISPNTPPGFVADYLWQDGTTSPDFQPPGPGTYWLNIVFDGGECQLTDSITITAPPFALPPGDTVSTCGPAPVTFTYPGAGAVPYQWIVLSGGLMGQTGDAITVTGPAEVLLTQTLNGCRDTAFFLVQTAATITVDTTITVCAGDTWTTDQTTYAPTDGQTESETYRTAAGCDSVRNLTFVVPDPAALVLNVTTTDATCADPLAGTIFVDIADGTTPILTLDGASISGDQTLTGYAAGTYVLQITDNATCVFTRDVIVGSDGSNVTVDTTITLCAGDTWTTARTTYAPTDGQTETENYLTTTGCDSVRNLTFVVPDPAALVLNVTTTDATCADPLGGTIFIDLATGASPTLTLDGAPVTGNQTLTGYAAGTYTLTVEDATGCRANRPVTINSGGGSVTIDTTLNACAGTDYVTARGTYRINRDTAFTERYVAANGCDSIRNLAFVTETAPDPLLGVRATPVTCAGDTDGTLELGTYAGTDLTDLRVDGVAYGPGWLLRDLPAGYYVIRTATALGCARVDSVLVASPDSLRTTLPGSIIVSPGVPATLTSNVSGGTPGYAYAWTGRGGVTLSCSDCPDPEVTTNANGAVDYVITDANGCTLTGTVDVVVSTRPVVRTDTSLTVCPGSSFTTTFGTYLIAGDSTFTETYRLPRGADSIRTYVLTVYDVMDFVRDVRVTSGDCADPNGSLFIETDPAVTGRLTFRGMTVPANTLLTDIPAGDYPLEITYGDNCVATRTVTVPVAAGVVTRDSTASFCAPTRFTTPRGDYFVTRDTSWSETYFGMGGGCDTVRNYAITVTQDVDVLAGLVATDPTCAGEANGSLVIGATDVPADAFLTLNGQPVFPGAMIAGLGAGTYVLAASYGNGCAARDSVTLTEPAPLVLDVPGSVRLPNGGSAPVRATVTGGTPGYTYQWSSGNPAVVFSCTNCPEPQISSAETATVRVGVTDANGCRTFADVLVLTGNTRVSDTLIRSCAELVWTTPRGVYNIAGDSLIEEEYVTADGFDSLRILRFLVDRREDFVGGIEVTQAGCDGVPGAELLVRGAGGNEYDYLLAGVTGETDVPLGVPRFGELPLRIAYTDACRFDTTLIFREPGRSSRRDTVVRLCGSGSLELPGGTYAIAGDTLIPEVYRTVRGCDSTVFYNVRVTPLPDVASLVTVRDLLCAGAGAGEVELGQGDQIRAYRFADSLYLGGEVIDSLPVGDYVIGVDYGEGCTLDYGFAVSEPPPLRVLLPERVRVLDGLAETVRVQVTGGTPGYEYTLSTVGPDSLGLSCTDCPFPTVTTFASGQLNVLITDANGCTLRDSVAVAGSLSRRVYLPTAFSPNGDGVNDRLTVMGPAGVARVSYLRVYDRWGGLVYSAGELELNDLSGGWDGGSYPVGVYQVVYELVWGDGRRTSGGGGVQLLR